MVVVYQMLLSKKLIFKKKKIFLKCSVICLLLSAITLAILYCNSEMRLIANLNIHLDDNFWIPDGGNNETGWPKDVVPNIVHYILFEKHRITYVHLLSFFSVLRIHQPAFIYIHCDCDKIDEDDDNWQRILQFVNKTNDVTIFIKTIERPSHINGIKIRDDYRNFHGSDITRYRLLRKYGGIYIDNDVLICQPLHKFRRYEFTLNWDEGQSLGSQILIGNRNARFLKFVLESYKMYDTNKWYYNAAELPTRAILIPYPQIIHRVKVKFGCDAPVACKYFYKEYNHNWNTDYYTFHMVARGDSIQWDEWCLGVQDHYMKHAKFSDSTILTMNNTFGELARYAIYGYKHAQQLKT